MKRKTWPVVIGGAALIVMLAGAAFIGGQLLTGAGSNGGLVPGSAPMANGKPQMRIEVEPAKELPIAAPDVIGPFVQRKDNSLFVAIGSKFMVLTNKDGSVSTEGMDSGQRVEVVVTSDTTLYADVTEQNMPRVPPADGKMQQVVEPGSIDHMGTNSIVSAWGERRGDRLTARVLVYTPAAVINAP